LDLSVNTMRSPRLLVTALCLVLLLPSLMPISATGVTSEGIPPTVDPYLAEMLGTWSDAEMVEVIVQFDGTITHDDRQFVRDMGFLVMREFHVIPAMALKGPAGLMTRMAAYGPVSWMEWNEPLEYFMDTTTTTIKATDTWRTEVVDPSGISRGYIDGTGITVVDLDSGVDAGHPDLDYGEKVIMNLKSDTNGIYTEVVDSDTSSGHGTHVAGTIAGTGDASQAARRGVAPGAKLVAISTGEGPAILNALGAMEWVYDHSRPGFNPYNIRIVSNSWGSTTEYNPSDAINQVSRKITYDNNVVVVFAAGNAGADNHAGGTVTTNPYSLEPGVMSIAAIEKDGSGLAYFSSRGVAKDNFTWPDFGAPGVDIWATQARKTYITLVYTQKNKNDDAWDGYYMAISGTSMATPHVSGVVALLWQACPSMRASDVHDDHQGIRPKDPQYWQNPQTRIHDSELILKLTSDYINETSDNGVPKGANWTGINDQPYDFAQGYGIVNVQKAVGLALTLEALRAWDPEASVWDAYEVFESINSDTNRTEATDILQTQWTGDWSVLNAEGTPVFTSFSRKVFVPQEAKEMIVNLQYSAIDTGDHEAVNLWFTIDTNGDGNPDYTGDMAPTTTGSKVAVIDVAGELGSARGKFVEFNLDGSGVSGPLGVISPGSSNTPFVNEYNEVIAEYHMGVTFRLGLGGGDVELMALPPDADVGQLDFGIPSRQYKGGNITLAHEQFVLESAVDSYLGSLAEDDMWETIEERLMAYLIKFFLFGLIVGVVVAVVGVTMYRHFRKEN